MMPDELIDLAIRIISEIPINRLTSSEKSLLQTAADGKIATRDDLKAFVETFKSYLPEDASETTQRAHEPPYDATEDYTSITMDDRPTYKPRPDIRHPYVITARDVQRTSTDTTNPTLTERTVFALSLIYPENMGLVTGAVEYVLEHQLGDHASDTDQLRRLDDGLRAVRQTADQLRDLVREKTEELRSRASEEFDDEPEYS